MTPSSEMKEMHLIDSIGQSGEPLLYRALRLRSHSRMKRMVLATGSVAKRFIFMVGLVGVLLFPLMYGVHYPDTVMGQAIITITTGIFREYTLLPYLAIMLSALVITLFAIETEEYINWRQDSSEEEEH